MQTVMKDNTFEAPSFFHGRVHLSEYIGFDSGTTIKGDIYFPWLSVGDRAVLHGNNWLLGDKGLPPLYHTNVYLLNILTLLCI